MLKMKPPNMNRKRILAIGVVALLLFVVALRYTDIIEFELDIKPAVLVQPDVDIVPITELSSEEFNALEQAGLIEETEGGGTGEHFSLEMGHVKFGQGGGYGNTHMWGGPTPIWTDTWTAFTSNERSENVPGRYALKGYIFGDSLTWILNNLDYYEVFIGVDGYTNCVDMYAKPGKINTFWSYYNANPPETDDVYMFLYAYRSSSEIVDQQNIFPSCYPGVSTIEIHPDSLWFDNSLDLSVVTPTPEGPGGACGGGGHEQDCVVKYGRGSLIYSGNSIFMYEQYKIDDTPVMALNPIYDLQTDNTYTVFDDESPAGWTCVSTADPVIYEYLGIEYLYECIGTGLASIKKTTIDFLYDLPQTTYSYASPFDVVSQVAGFTAHDLLVEALDPNTDQILYSSQFSNIPARDTIECTAEISGTVNLRLTASSIANYGDYSEVVIIPNINFAPPAMIVDWTTLQHGLDFDVSVEVVGVTGFIATVWVIDPSGNIAICSPQSATASSSSTVAVVTIENPQLQGPGHKIRVLTEKLGKTLADTTYTGITFTIPNLVINVPGDIKYGKSFDIDGYYQGITGTITVKIKQDNVLKSETVPITGKKITIPPNKVNCWGFVDVLVRVQAGAFDSEWVSHPNTHISPPKVEITTQPLTLSYGSPFDVAVLLYSSADELVSYNGVAEISVYIDGNWKTTKPDIIVTNGQALVPFDGYEAIGTIQFRAIATVSCASAGNEWHGSAENIERIIQSPEWQIVTPEEVDFGKSYTVTANVVGIPNADADVTIYDADGGYLKGPINKNLDTNTITIPSINIIGRTKLVFSSSRATTTERYVTYIQTRIKAYTEPESPIYGDDIFIKIVETATNLPYKGDLTVVFYENDNIGEKKTHSCPSQEECSQVLIAQGDRFSGPCTAEVVVMKGGIEFLNVGLAVDISWESPVTKIDLPDSFTYGVPFWIQVHSDVIGGKVTVVLKDGDKRPISQWVGEGESRNVYCEANPDGSNGPYLEGAGYLEVIFEYGGFTYPMEYPVVFGEIDIKVSFPSPYWYVRGDNFILEILYKNVPLENCRVDVLIEDSDEVTHSWLRLESPTPTVTAPNIMGKATITVIIYFEQLEKSFSKSVEFKGEPANVKFEYDSFVQFSKDPIEFDVIVTDALTNQHLPPALITPYYFEAVLLDPTGSWSEPNPQYLANGMYHVTTIIYEGQGEFRVTFHYTYKGKSVTHDETLILQVDPPGLSIETFFADSTAIVDELVRLKVNIYYCGDLKTPDNLWVEVFDPSGNPSFTIEKKDFVEKSEGVFELPFTFDETHNWKFWFHATMATGGVEPAMAPHTVAVSPLKSDLGPGPEFLSLLMDNMYLAMIVFFVALIIVVFIIIRRRPPIPM